MFTLATAFLIFAQSSFTVISTVILDLGLQSIGADIYAESSSGFINEVPMRTFIETQKEKGYVVDFAFATANYNDIAKLSDVMEGFAVKDIDDYSSITNIFFVGVPQNFLNVTGTDFVILEDYQEVDGLEEIDGVPDIISLLYTEEGVDQYVTYPESNQNGYDVFADY